MNMISATNLKNNISQVINSVVFTKSETFIERHGKIVAKIVPVEVNTKNKNLVAESFFWGTS